MYFASPLIMSFLLPVLLILIAGLFISSKIRRKKLDAFIDSSLKPVMIEKRLTSIRTFKDTCLVFAVLFLFVAFARPQWGKKESEVTSKGQDIIVAIDVSLSMLAEDMKPNRLEKAKFELKSFIESLKTDRIGIITFAGRAFLQCPLTLDYEAAKMYLDIIDPGSIPVPGTAIAEAINLAVKAFEETELKNRVLIIITDGEDHEGKVLEAAAEAKKQGVVIHVIGIGSTTGEPIPLRDGSGSLIGYKKDKSGSIVTTKLNDELLRKIALVGGGNYFSASTTQDELSRILYDISKMEKKTHSSLRLDRYQDRYGWFLVLGLVFLLLETIFPETTLRRKDV